MLEKEEYEIVCRAVKDWNTIIKDGDEYYAYGKAAQFINELCGIPTTMAELTPRVQFSEQLYQTIIERTNSVVVIGRERLPKWKVALQLLKTTGSPFRNGSRR